MIIRRLLGNFIDFFIYLLAFYILVITTGPDIKLEYLDFLYFIAFVVALVFPILLLNNTIGKKVVKLKWQDSINQRVKLCIKYSLYYVTFAPGLSIASAVSSIPFIHSKINFSFTNSTIILLTFILSDSIVFALSKGRYHILDYLLTLKLKEYSFFRSYLKTSGIIYLLTGIWLLLTAFSYKHILSFEELGTEINSIVHKEQYPQDLFYGNNVLTTKIHTEDVFTPSEPTSFLYSKPIPQKTLHLNLPKQVFDSEKERIRLSIELITQSLKNDRYSKFSPTQTRIIISSYEYRFLIQENLYYYTYYFENQLPEWGIYGGISSDSSTIKSYTKFISDYNKSVLDRINSIEKKYDLSWTEIIKKTKENKQLEDEIKQILGRKLQYSTFKNGLNIYMDTLKLEIKNISFKNAELHGYKGFKFPIARRSYYYIAKDILNGGTFQHDENVNTLNSLRDLIREYGL